MGWITVSKYQKTSKCCGVDCEREELQGGGHQWLCTDCGEASLGGDVLSKMTEQHTRTEFVRPRDPLANDKPMQAGYSMRNRRHDNR